MDIRMLLKLSPIALAGCTQMQSHQVVIPPLPTCADIYQILQNANSEFDNLKSGPKIQMRGSVYPYWGSTISLPGANECIIRERDIASYQFRCSWVHGSDRASMGQHYQALRDKVVSCVGDVQVSRNDLRGYTVIYLEPMSQLAQLQYWVRAKYESPPYTVNFDIETRR